MKITIAEAMRRLPVGTEFTGEFLNPLPTMDPARLVTRRKVKRQTPARMVSTFLDGPRAGNEIELNWRGVTADERDGAIYLTMNETGREFLRITFDRAPTPAG